jgi:hypothetical protein
MINTVVPSSTLPDISRQQILLDLLRQRTSRRRVLSRVEIAINDNMRRPWFRCFLVLSAERLEFGLEQEGNVVRHTDAVETQTSQLRVE